MTTNFQVYCENNLKSILEDIDQTNNKLKIHKITNNTFNSEDKWDVIIDNSELIYFKENNLLKYWDSLVFGGYYIIQGFIKDKVYEILKNLETNTYSNNMSTENNTRLLYNNDYCNIKVEDNFFTAVIKKKLYKNLDTVENIIIITSLVNCNKESVFKINERFEQTKHTIHTLKEKIPNSFICLIDASKLNKEEETYLIGNVDMLINCNNVESVANIVYTNKHAGENLYTLYAFEALNNIKETTTIGTYNFSMFPKLKNIFKISGRYYLNDNFNYIDYDNNYNVIKIVDPNVWCYKCVTCFYKININYINDYIGHLKSTKHMLLNNNDYSIVCEHILFLYIIYNSSILKNPKELGVSGKLSINGTLCSC